MDVHNLATAFQEYRWENKHPLFGFEPDRYPSFSWIVSLETRFAWVRSQPADQFETPILLVREMIQWGGSQNGILQRFDENLGRICLRQALCNVIEALDRPEDAIRAALEIPAFGLTYASKLLRFLDPVRHAALDSQIREFLPELQRGFPAISDGNINSMTAGYLEFLKLLEKIKGQAEQAGVARPKCRLGSAPASPGDWRNADIEMALFAWANRRG